jgi:hypothetical protein
MCYKQKGNYIKIVYIPKSNIRLYKVSSNVFSKLELYKNTDPYLKYYFIWQDIKFNYYENGQITYEDNL